MSYHDHCQVMLYYFNYCIVFLRNRSVKIVKVSKLPSRYIVVVVKCLPQKVNRMFGARKYR